MRAVGARLDFYPSPVSCQAHWYLRTCPNKRPFLGLTATSLTCVAHIARRVETAGTERIRRRSANEARRSPERPKNACSPMPNSPARPFLGTVWRSRKTRSQFPDSGSQRAARRIGRRGVSETAPFFGLPTPQGRSWARTRCPERPVRFGSRRRGAGSRGCGRFSSLRRPAKLGSREH